MDTIDVRGLSCPEPVILVKNAMASGKKEYKVLTDSTVSRENITRFAEHAGYRVSAEAQGAECLLTIAK